MLKNHIFFSKIIILFESKSQLVTFTNIITQKKYNKNQLKLSLKLYFSFLK